MLSAEFSSDNLSDKSYYAYSNAYVENSNYRVYAAVDEPLREGDDFYDLYQEFVLAKTSMPYLFVVSTVAFFAVYDLFGISDSCGIVRKQKAVR